MATEYKGVPISSLPEATSLNSSDELIAYRGGQAYRSSVGTLGESANNNISDAFSSSKSYAVGDYCIYDDTLYKCTTAHNKVAWNSSHFEAVTVGEELSELNTNIVIADCEIQQSATAGGVYTPSVSVAKNGYTAIGVMGVQATNSYVNIYRANIDSSQDLCVSFRGLDGMSSTTVTFTCRVLYMKA